MIIFDISADVMKSFDNLVDQEAREGSADVEEKPHKKTHGQEKQVTSNFILENRHCIHKYTNIQIHKFILINRFINTKSLTFGVLSTVQCLC